MAHLDPRTGQVVEMRFFGGLSVEETAEVRMSPITVTRNWSFAGIWLYRELSGVRRDGFRAVGAG